MKLVLLNPNISDSVSALIRAEAERSKSAATQIDVLTAPFGVAYIETRFEAMIGAYAVAQMAGDCLDRADAMIVAAFGDPGLAALREVSPVPVTGLTEAALASASLLGGRFSIIAISRRIRAWYRETVAFYGMSGRLASIRSLDESLADIGTVQQDQGETLLRLAHQAVDEDQADVIVLAGAPLAGLARTLRDRLPVPVVDGVSSAVRHAESLVALGAPSLRGGSYAAPPEKAQRGLPDPVVRLMQSRSGRR